LLSLGSNIGAAAMALPGVSSSAQYAAQGGNVLAGFRRF